MKILLTILIILSTLVSAKNIKIEKHEYFTKGFRILVNVSINDDKGIYEARTYFKNNIVKDYQVYVSMACLGNRCSAELPLTDKSLRELNFIIVYQSSNGEVFKSDTYSMEKRDMLELPSWQTRNTKNIKLYTDYGKPMKFIRGFYDSFNIYKSIGDALGIKAGLYTTKMINPKTKIDCSVCTQPNKNEISSYLKDK